MKDYLAELYYRLTLARTLVAWLLMAVFIALSLYYAKDFQLDASADSLVLENDKDLRYYRGIRARYGSDDFLVVTYSPKNDLFSDAVLSDLKILRDELASLERVDAVTSILDVPLIDSPRMSLAELQKQVRVLDDPATDRELARREFSESPLYRSLLTSIDGTTTAMLVNFKRDERYETLLERREELRAKQLQTELSAEEAAELERVSLEFKRYTVELQAQEQADIAAVRAILDRHRDGARIHLGGVPMITSDMIDFVRSDIRIFGIGVAIFLITLLGFAFKRLRWIAVPMLICSAAVIGMVGYLGLVEWRVTVVSSNFISLL
ncbi:MAG: MMPL family transporter, partial [Sedimenticola sp.]